MDDEGDTLDLQRRRGEVCEWCTRPARYRVYLGQGEVQGACAEHAERMRGGLGPDPAAVLRGDVAELVRTHGLSAVLAEVARQAPRGLDGR